MNEENLIAIYDFGLYPYALGDVLTFNIQTAIKCINYKKKHIQLLICCDKNYCSNFDQRGFINPKNYQTFYSELAPAFSVQAIDYEIIYFDSRKKLIDYLKKVRSSDDINFDIIKDYLFHIGYIKNDLSVYLSRVVNKIRKLEKNTKSSNINNININNNFIIFLSKLHEKLYNKLNKNRSIINSYFVNNIYSHRRINLFFQSNKIIPYLKINHKYCVELNDFLEKKYPGNVYIAIHIRQRKNDKKFGDNVSSYRDSNIEIWINFLNSVMLNNKNIIFILLGRTEEKSKNLLSLPNVINLRDFGMHLGHDLAAVEVSKMFLGSSSGFAAYANFSKTPYAITNMNTNSCRAYEIEFGADSLPFANEKQKLLYEQESVELLNKYFKFLMGNHA